jgi:hypothetical protein
MHPPLSGLRCSGAAEKVMLLNVSPCTRAPHRSLPTPGGS